MDTGRIHERMGRRAFLKACTAAAAGLPLMGLTAAPEDRALATAQRKGQDAMDKTVLSFFCDDTSTFRAGPFGEFLDYVKAEGIAGESSVIIGIGSTVLSDADTELKRAYIEQLHRAYDCGIGAHMELMTHGGRFDFQLRRVPDGAIYEGLWLHEPDVSVEEYETYLGSIIAEGERIGVKFTGLTWPGGGGPEVSRRYAELRGQGITNLSPNCWQALLNLAKKGKFRNRTVPCFVHGPNEVRQMAADGPHGVYDMPVLGEDWLGRWDNSPERVNPDYYITADGQGGGIADTVRKGMPYCFFHAHWQGLNPESGCGWEAFKLVVQRIKDHLGDRVVWMRPSEFTDWWHQRLHSDAPAEHP